MCLAILVQSDTVQQGGTIHPMSRWEGVVRRTHGVNVKDVQGSAVRQFMDFMHLEREAPSRF